MNLDEKLMLVSSLGQIKQLRVWLPKSDIASPEDEDLQLFRTDELITLQVMGLEVDLYGKLTKLVNFLNSTGLIKEKDIAFDIDLESMEDAEDFSVMLNYDGDLILLYSAKTDKQRMQQWLMVEWTKILNKVKGN